MADQEASLSLTNLLPLSVSLTVPATSNPGQLNLRTFYDQTLYITETQTGALNLYKGGPSGKYLASLSVGQHWPGWEVDRVAQDLY